MTGIKCGYLCCLVICLLSVTGQLFCSDISSNYIFNYQTNVLDKTDESNVKRLYQFEGKMEMSSFVLTDKQELLLLKLNVENKLRPGSEKPRRISVVGVVIRKDGLATKLVVENSAKPESVNLLKGLVNILNLHDLRLNGTEHDVSGECSVNYHMINDYILRKNKTNCELGHADFEYNTKQDSFSIFQDSKVYTDYVFDKAGGLISVVSFETHSIEPVLFQTLTKEFSASTVLTLSKLIESPSLMSSSNLKAVIHSVLGDDVREIFLQTSLESNYSGFIEDSHFFVKQAQAIFLLKSKPKTVMNLVKLLRRASAKDFIDKVVKSKQAMSRMKLVHDSLINCGTKLCSVVLLDQLQRSLTADVDEALRILVMLQHVRNGNNFLVGPLWKMLKGLDGNVYNQGVQSVASLLERCMSSDEFMTSTIQSFARDVRSRLHKCNSDLCYLVHLSAMKNSRLRQFYGDIRGVLLKSGRYANKVIAAAVNSVYFLHYNEAELATVRKSVLELVRSKINFFNDTFLQYQCINTLILFQVDTEQLVMVLDELVITSVDFRFFLVRKLASQMELGVVSEPAVLRASKLWRQSQFELAIYPEQRGSRFLTATLAETNNSLVDTHLSVFSSHKTGTVQHSLTDLYLVTTATENHLFSLSVHLSGLESFVGSTGTQDTTLANEPVEGYAQMTLLGREASPVTLFSGSTGLLSAVWSAPADLTPLLQAVFVPLDLERRLHFQGGPVLPYRHLGAVSLELAASLSFSVWYKTGESRVKASGELFAETEYGSELRAKVGPIDAGLLFETSLDFSSSDRTHSCFRASLTESMSNQGQTLFMSPRLNQECSTMHQ